jgi:hypothetical protein
VKIYMKEFLAIFSGFHQTVFRFLAVHNPHQLFSQLTAHNSFFHSHIPTKQTLKGAAELLSSPSHNRALFLLELPLSLPLAHVVAGVHPRRSPSYLTIRTLTNDRARSLPAKTAVHPKVEDNPKLLTYFLNHVLNL